MAEQHDLLRDVVRNGRLRLGLSQTEFGRKVGISQKAVSQLERGEILQPRPGILLRIANVLGEDNQVVFRAMLRSSGGSTLDQLFQEGDVPLELQATIENLIVLSPEQQDVVRRVVAALAAAEQSHSVSAHSPTMELAGRLERLTSVSQHKVEGFIAALETQEGEAISPIRV